MRIISSEGKFDISFDISSISLIKIWPWPGLKSTVKVEKKKRKEKEKKKKKPILRPSFHWSTNLKERVKNGHQSISLHLVY